MVVENVEKFELQRIDECDLEDAQKQASPAPVLKHLDTADSLASNDSDLFLSTDAELSDKKEDLPEDAHMADNDTSESGSDDNTSSNEKDSGCEVTTDQTCEEGEKSASGEEEPFVPPDDELVNRIVAQVEFYFSDANITKDAFLLKHVRRNKEGYVSLKLISSFKRVKHLAKDWRAVAYALERSTKLEVNEARTKLRRVDPLPAFDQTTPSRTVIAINLPAEKSTIESVAELFRPCGEIALIRILRPGGQIPAEVRSFANKHPEMTGCMSALIEFERTESAKFAVERQDQDWRSNVKGMKVVELNAPSPVDRKKRPQNKKVKEIEQELSSSCQSGSEAEHESKFRQRPSSSPFKTGDLMHRRYSSVRDPGSDFICRDQYRDRIPCSCCCERRYSSSGSGYDSPTPTGFRRYSVTRDHLENYPVRRHSGVENPCCMSLRRCSRDSGSESSGSFTRPHEIPRRFSRDSLSGSEGVALRRFSRDSISSEGSSSFRRFSRDSVSSDVFVPPFLSRNSSRDIIEVNRRSSFGSATAYPDHHVLVHSGSRSSFTVPCVTAACPPHVPENVVRMPKGPDGSKGFGGSS